MKRFISLLLTVVLFLSYFTFYSAEAVSLKGIKSIPCQQQIEKLAISGYKEHLSLLIETHELPRKVCDYTLGKPFTIFNVVSKTNSTCFPILKDNNILSIFEISSNDNKTIASMSKSFSKELNDLLRANTYKDYVLLTDGIHLQAFDGISSFYKVQTNINSNKPMHLGLKGHSVGLIGYKKIWGKGKDNKNILILLEPNGGTKKLYN